MTVIKNISSREVARRFKVPFSTAQGEKTVMRSIIVRVDLSDGSSGLGECPTSLSLRNETIQTIASTLRSASRKMRGLAIEEYDSAIAQLRKAHPSHPMTISGLEVALFRASLVNKGISEHVHWGGKKGGCQTDITIPFVLDKAILARWINYAFREGFTEYKLKVSGNVEKDKEILSFVYDVLRTRAGGFTLCLDGNQGYSTQTFLQIQDYIARNGFAIEFFEQPLAKDDYRGLKEIRRFSPFPVVLDETVLTIEDARRVIGENLADGINIKVAKSGVRESGLIFETARKYGLKLMIGCMTETMVGLSAAINLAAGTGGFDYIDLDSIHLLYHKNRYGNISIQGPCFLLQPPQYLFDCAGR